MFIKSVAIAALVAITEARFGQEQCQPALGDIQAVTSGGQPGQAATIAGGAISNLLAAADPCDQARTADNIVATLGTGADSIKAAKEFLNCEKNFNPFVQSTPTLCTDATLPTTAELRGVLPKIDPAVVGSDVANQLANQSLVTPFDATGKSIAEVFTANGFTNFTGGANTSTATASASSVVVSAAAASTAAAASSTADDECDADPATSATATAVASAVASSVVASSAAATVTAAASTNITNVGSSTATGGGSFTNTVSTIAGDDFGLCNPGMKFESGINGRKATEFTFQAADPKISAIQEEALNFNIIANRICDELTNQCQSNAAAKATCASAKTAIANLPKIRSTADTWNTMLGFAGQDTNPDNTSTVGEPTS